MLQIEAGRAQDAAIAAELIVDTGRGLFTHFSGGDLQTWAALCESEWRTEHGVYSHSLSHLARQGEQVLGLLIGYSAKRKATLDWSFAASRARLAPERWAAIAAAMPLAGFLSPLLPDDAWYLQNIVVHAAARGTGLRVGARLMQTATDEARAAGCASVHLDVDESYPAVDFYKRLGYEVLVRTEVPGLPGIHPHLRMVRAV
jgi:ribosomal protein S18 acetylase RimI-like enzyme